MHSNAIGKHEMACFGKIKDRPEKNEILGVVYAFGCKECSKVYIGETKRIANQRMKEHNADMRMGCAEKSAIAYHVHATGLEVHWETRVIEKEQHGGRRKVKEAIHIHRM